MCCASKAFSALPGGALALRWASAAFEATAANFRKIMGHQQLWMLKAHLEQSMEKQKLGETKRAG
jgi:hypothetical protein